MQHGIGLAWGQPWLTKVGTDGKKMILPKYITLYRHVWNKLNKNINKQERQLTAKIVNLKYKSQHGGLAV